MEPILFSIDPELIFCPDGIDHSQFVYDHYEYLHRKGTFLPEVIVEETEGKLVVVSNHIALQVARNLKFPYVNCTLRAQHPRQLIGKLKTEGKIILRDLQEEILRADSAKESVLL